MKNVVENLWIILDRKQWFRILLLFIIVTFGAIIDAVGIVLLPSLLSGLMGIGTTNT